MVASPLQIVSEWRGHTLVIWQEAPAVEDVREFARTVARLTTQHPGRSACLVVMRALPNLPSEVTRQMYVELARKVNSSLNCVGVALECDGFASAAQRAIITGISLTAKIRFPMRSYSSLPDLYAWVQPRLQVAGAQLGTYVEFRNAFAYLDSQMKSAAVRR